MDESRPTQRSQFPAQSRRSARTSARLELPPSRLGRTLRDAREAKGLDLRDLAALTNVRVMHLEALEKGDLDNLPGDAYGKNFVRLYAQAVGLEPSRMLLLYGQERRSLLVGGTAAAEKRLELPPAAPGSRFDNPRLNGVLRLLATLLLVAFVVLTGLWLFNRTLAPSPDAPNPTALSPIAPNTAAPDTPAPNTAAPRTTAPSQTASPPQAATRATSPAPAAQMVLLSVRTTPPGSEVSVDGYLLGTSPLEDAPVQAGRRTVRVSRQGYRPFERLLELSGNRRLNVVLTPVGAQPPAAVQGQVTLTVTEEAWLEIYRGSTRDAGSRLVYETAPAGATYTFDAPVYVFSGNASGVRATWNGQTAALGDGVTGRAYSAE